MMKLSEFVKLNAYRAQLNYFEMATGHWIVKKADGMHYSTTNEDYKNHWRNLFENKIGNLEFDISADEAMKILFGEEGD